MTELTDKIQELVQTAKEAVALETLLQKNARKLAELKNRMASEVGSDTVLQGLIDKITTDARRPNLSKPTTGRGNAELAEQLQNDWGTMVVLETAIKSISIDAHATHDELAKKANTVPGWHIRPHPDLTCPGQLLVEVTSRPHEPGAMAIINLSAGASFPKIIDCGGYTEEEIYTAYNQWKKPKGRHDND